MKARTRNYSPDSDFHRSQRSGRELRNGVPASDTSDGILRKLNDRAKRPKKTSGPTIHDATFLGGRLQFRWLFSNDAVWASDNEVSMTSQMQELNDGSIQRFLHETEGYLKFERREGQHSGRILVDVDGEEWPLRIKRAGEHANQIEIWRGEPVVLHLPPNKNNPDEEKWFVLPVLWQIDFARNFPESAHHSSSTLDCLIIPNHVLAVVAARFEVVHSEVPLGEALATACIGSIQEARRDDVRDIVAGIDRMRQLIRQFAVASLEGFAPAITRACGGQTVVQDDELDFLRLSKTLAEGGIADKRKYKKLLTQLGLQLQLRALEGSSPDAKRLKKAIERLEEK